MQPTVSLIRCPTYEQEAVESAVRNAINKIGGISTYVSAGQTVLLKPNLVLGSQPETAVCTHPSVLKAMIHLIQEVGAHPIIGDSPGGPFNTAWVRPMYRKSGWLAVAEETGATLNMDFTDSQVSLPDGVAIKGMELGNYVTAVDAIITLPKLKTHGLMHLTGATKILFGTIPGTNKLAYHAKFPDRNMFAEMLIDILSYLQPTLCLMDAIIGMDGTGPTAGNPFPVGALLASSDSVALDIVAANLVHLAIEDIPTIQSAIRRHLSSGKRTDIRILGDSPESFGITGFRPPGTRNSRNSILNLLGQNMQNVVKDSLVAAPHATSTCIACGFCARSCPVQAITIQDGRAIMNLKNVSGVIAAMSYAPKEQLR